MARCNNGVFPETLGTPAGLLHTSRAGAGDSGKMIANGPFCGTGAHQRTGTIVLDSWSAGAGGVKHFPTFRNIQKPSPGARERSETSNTAAGPAGCRELKGTFLLFPAAVKLARISRSRDTVTRLSKFGYKICKSTRTFDKDFGTPSQPESNY